MRQVHVDYPGRDLDFSHAAALAKFMADEDTKVIEPVLMAWCDRQALRMSPVIEGADLRNRWRVYGESHGGRLEIDIGENFAFIYGDSSAFDPYEASPYSNLRDAAGREYLCQINLLPDRHQPLAGACTPLDEWTSKLT